MRLGFRGGVIVISFSVAALPLYFKSAVTAVAATVIEEGCHGLVAVGTEDGEMVLLTLEQNNAGVLELPSVALDRQVTPREQRFAHK